MRNLFAILGLGLLVVGVLLYRSRAVATAAELANAAPALAPVAVPTSFYQPAARPGSRPTLPAFRPSAPAPQ